MISERVYIYRLVDRFAQLSAECSVYVRSRVPVGAIQAAGKDDARRKRARYAVCLSIVLLLLLHIYM